MPRWNPDEPHPGWHLADRIAARMAAWRGRGRPPSEGAREAAGRGPKGYRRADERILDEVCERFARSGVDAREVEVEVKEGVVTLGGHVESRDDRRLLAAVAEGILGVSDVDDRMRVRAPPPEETAGAGTGTGGTGLTMSARQAGAPAPAQQSRSKRR
jgi:hypothetical protein